MSFKTINKYYEWNKSVHFVFHIQDNGGLQLSRCWDQEQQNKLGECHIVFGDRKGSIHLFDARGISPDEVMVITKVLLRDGYVCGMGHRFVCRANHDFESHFGQGQVFSAALRKVQTSNFIYQILQFIFIIKMSKHSSPLPHLPMNGPLVPYQGSIRSFIGSLYCQILICTHLHNKVLGPVHSLPIIHGHIGVTQLCYHKNSLYSAGRDGTYRQYRLLDTSLEVTDTKKVGC